MNAKKKLNLKIVPLENKTAPWISPCTPDDRRRYRGVIGVVADV